MSHPSVSVVFRFAGVMFLITLSAFVPMTRRDPFVVGENNERLVA